MACFAVDEAYWQDGVCGRELLKKPVLSLVSPEPLSKVNMDNLGSKMASEGGN